MFNKQRDVQVTKKYILSYLLFIVLLTASGSVGGRASGSVGRGACAESLMVHGQLDGRTLRELAPSSQYMLHKASLIAYASGSQTVNAKHILLAALTRVETSNKKLNRLNMPDPIDNTPHFNGIALALKKYIHITMDRFASHFKEIEGVHLRRFQEALLKSLHIPLKPLQPIKFPDSILFEVKNNDLLVLHLGDLDFIPTLIYDESAIALIKVAIVYTRSVASSYASRYMYDMNDDRHINYNREDNFYPLPVTPEYFFLALRGRYRRNSFLDIETQKLHELVGDIFFDIGVGISYYFFEDLGRMVANEHKPLILSALKKVDEAVQLALKKGSIKEAAEQLGLTYKTLKGWVLQDPEASHQLGHQTKEGEEKAILSRKLEDLFANHQEGLTLEQIKAGISEFANMSDGTIYKRLKEHGYESQGKGIGRLGLWNHQGHYTREKAKLRRKLEALFAGHQEGLTLEQIKAGIREFANMSNWIIERRLMENGYERQGNNRFALRDQQQGHQTKKGEEKAILRRKLEDLFANHQKGLTFEQIKAGISEFANISRATIYKRLMENGYEAQGHGTVALWYPQGH